MRIVASVILLALLSCHDPSSVNQLCVRGRYITSYCEGVVIQIVDGTPIGQEWRSSLYGLRPHCVVANLDSRTFKGSSGAVLTQNDSTFYFQFWEGGYPQKAYVLCHPPSFITITAISETACR